MSIIETGYDPEFGIYRGMYQITQRVNGQIVSTQTVNNPTPQELTIAYLKVVGLFQYIATDATGAARFDASGNGVTFQFNRDNSDDVGDVLNNTTFFSSSNNTNSIRE